jgi:hypothetical protein
VIDREDIPSIHCKASHKGPVPMRKVNGPSHIFINFHVPVLIQCLSYIQVSSLKRTR